MELSNIKEYYKENKLIIHCILIAILFFVNCFVPHFSYVGYSVVAICILLSNTSDGFSALVFSIPYCCIDDYSSVLLFFICFLIFLIKAYIVMYVIEKKKPNIAFLISLGVFAAYTLLPLFEYNVALFIKLGIICLLGAFFNLYLSNKDALRIKFNVSILALSMMISTCFYLTHFVSPYMKTKEVYYHDEDFIRFSSLLINPNTLAMLCEICLALLTYFIISNRCTWIDCLAFVTFSALGIFTLSKTFLILYCVMILTLLVYLCRSFKKQVFWIICSICIVVIFLIIFANDFIFTYLGRFMNVDPEDLTFNEIMNIVTTGRYDLWRGVADYLFMNPVILIFGRGLGAPLIESMSAHNFFLSLTYEVGIIGGILFMSLFVAPFIYQMKQDKKRINWRIVVPIVIISMLMMVEDLFLYVYN